MTVPRNRQHVLFRMLDRAPACGSESPCSCPGNLLNMRFNDWKQEQDLMMTDQEIRDEMKETEGDPQVAELVESQVQRQLMMQRAEIVRFPKPTSWSATRRSLPLRFSTTH